MHLHITRAAIEESLDGVDIAVLLNHDTLEGDGRNLELARHLRIHDVLTPGDTTVRTAVDDLGVKHFLLWLWYLLRVEALQIGHLAVELGKVDLCIDLIGKEHRLLLVHTLLVGSDLDEEVVARDGRTRLTHARLIGIIVVHPGCSARVVSMARDGDLDRMGCKLLAINQCMRGTDGVSSSLACIERVGDGERGRRAGVAVDHLIARLRRGIGSGYHLQSIGHIAHTELLHFTGVDRIGYSEVLASSNMCWCRYRHTLRLGFLRQTQHHEYHQCVPFYLLHNEIMFAYCFTSSCRTACVVADSSPSASSAWWPSPAARMH